MTPLRPVCLNSVLVCLYGLTAIISPLQAQNPPAQPADQQQQQPRTPPAKPQQQPNQQRPPAQPAQQPNNPFETVQPAGPPQAQPQNPPSPGAPPAPPQFEAPKPAAPGETANGPTVAPNVIEAITFRGSRRVPQDTLRALIRTRAG